MHALRALGRAVRAHLLKVLTMLDQRFEIKLHPSYKRDSRVYFFIGAITLATIILSGHIFDIHKEHFLHDYFIVFAFLFFIVWLITLFILDRKVKCPSCQRKVTKTKRVVGENLYLNCINCMVAWDTGIEWTEH